MKRLVLALLVLAAFAPVGADAAVPCRDRIYNDWYADGKIATSYSIACYRDALKHVPADARTYSSLADDIRAAMRGAQARKSGHTGVPVQIGKGSGGVQPASASSSSSSTRPSDGKPSKDPKSHDASSTKAQPVSQTLPTTTVASGQTGGGSGVPVPLLVLGALALLLIAVGAVGAIVKRRRI